MTDTTEELIRSIEEADEYEILEFDFDPVFEALRERDSLRAQLDAATNDNAQLLTISELQSQLEAARAQIERLEVAGNLMSNALFNIRQQHKDRLPESTVFAIQNLPAMWDDARLRQQAKGEAE